MTGQTHFDSDEPSDVGLQTAVELTNALSVRGSEDPAGDLARILAVDPPSAARLTPRDIDPMIHLSARVHEICGCLVARDVDGAARRVNALLGEHSAQPHLALEGGRWRLHHHPPDAEVVSMWTAISADALARLIDAGRHDRIGRCAAAGCELFFVDASKNGSRRFCSLACQNRVKAAAYRKRRQGI